MNFSAVVHNTKSRYSYAYDNATLHVRIKTPIGEVQSIKVRAVDPFNWSKREDGVYRFDTHTIKMVDMEYEGTTMYHDVWFAQIKDIDTLRIRYGFVMKTVEGDNYLYGCDSVENIDKDTKKGENVFNYFNFPYVNEEDIYKAPKWVKDTIWYQLTPTAFSDDGKEAKDNTCGNFKGLIKKLDFIQEMGYTAIYMTPIFEGYSWHLYDTTDYFNVSHKLGGNEGFKEFIVEAHKRGIKIMLDAVFNHCGPLHPFWQDVIKNGKESKYFDCFYVLDENKPILNVPINPDGTYEDVGSRLDNNVRTFAYTLNMPKLNTSNPQMRQYLLDVAKFWVEEFDIDGWRLDVSNEVSHEFWREFRKVVKTVKEDVYIMGENWDDSYPWLQGDQFDSVMNYGFMNVVWGYIAPEMEKIPKLNASQYKIAITELATKYPKHLTESLFNIVCSHDVDRSLTVCNNNRDMVVLFYTLLLTYSGSPCVYYGDEVGIAGDEGNNRVPMIFDESRQDVEMKNHVKNMINIRKNNPVLKNIKQEFLLTDDETNTIIFKKGDVIVLIYNNEKAGTITLPLEIQNKEFEDIYHNTKVKLSKEINLEPYEFMILKG
ncbi:MAG: glycoside hydrolase family 13 protein [Eubacteriales bacterium]